MRGGGVVLFLCIVDAMFTLRVYFDYVKLVAFIWDKKEIDEEATKRLPSSFYKSLRDLLSSIEKEHTTGTENTESGEIHGTCFEPLRKSSV
jgi:hypothetical protein